MVALVVAEEEEASEVVCSRLPAWVFGVNLSVFILQVEGLVVPGRMENLEGRPMGLRRMRVRALVGGGVVVVVVGGVVFGVERMVEVGGAGVASEVEIVMMGMKSLGQVGLVEGVGVVGLAGVTVMNPMEMMVESSNLVGLVGGAGGGGVVTGVGLVAMMMMKTLVVAVETGRMEKSVSGVLGVCVCTCEDSRCMHV